MKKLYVLIILAIMILTSCKAEDMFITDDQIVDDIFHSFISAINSHDKDAVKTLFSDKAILDGASFDDDLNVLFDYCKGHLTVCESNNRGSISEQKDGDYRRKTIRKDYVIEGDNAKYRVYVYVIATDTSNPDEVGLCSFYIIKVNEDMDLSYSYVGDLKNTPGINVGIENYIDEGKITDVVFDLLVEAIESRNEEAIKDLFSDEIITNNETFDEDLNDLLDYCEGPFEYFNSVYSGLDISKQTSGERIQKAICSSHEIYKGSVRYQIRICVLVPDITNTDELELLSLYIIKVDDSIDYDYAYKGDGKNTPGINIGIEHYENSCQD